MSRVYIIHIIFVNEITPFRSLRPLEFKEDVGKVQEDQAEDRAGVLLGLKARVGAKLVGSVPEALFQRGGRGIFLGRATQSIKKNSLITIRTFETS
jgi:hypothetical protein